MLARPRSRSRSVWVAPVIWFGTGIPWGGASWPSARPSTAVAVALAQLRHDVGGVHARALPPGGAVGVRRPDPATAAAKLVPAAILSWMACAEAWSEAMMKFRHSWVTSAWCES